jgi:hypothetical protein
MTTAEGRVALAHPRLDVAAALRRVRWRDVLVVAAAALCFAGVTIATAFTVVDLHLPPDGAHYIGDADALIGRGVRELRHPPAFPALVALAMPFAGRADSFAWAMTAAMALLPVSLYVLARRWFSFGPSLIGAVTASLLPVIGELYSWGGGATLLGTVLLIFALAVMEAWIDRGGKRGFLLGACLAAIALTHALPLAMAVVILAVRWVVLLISQRRLTAGWDPLGWRGIASVLVVSVPVLLLVLPLHQGPSTSIGIPRAPTAWSLLVWAVGNEQIFWIIGILSIVGLQLSGRPGVVVYGATCLAMIILYPALLDADVTYANRAEYLGPIVIALGIASLATFVRDRGSGRLPVLARPALAVIVALFVVAATAYVPKVQAAAPYYNPWLSRRDLRLLGSMAGDDGVVATSWRSNVFTDGVQLAWYVEGLATRRAYGPADDTLSNIEDQFEGGLDMQRLFAGTDVIENGAVQVAAALIGSSSDLSIQVRSDGFNYPFLVVRSLSGRFPRHPEAISSEIDGDRLLSTFEDDRGRAVFERKASLDGNAVLLRYDTAPASDGGRWMIDLAASPGLAWSDLRQLEHRVQGRVNINGETQRFSVTAETETDVGIVQDPTGTVIRVEGPRSRAIEFEVRVTSDPEPGRVVAFEQEALLREYEVSSVLVARDTGVLPRFDVDPCYERVRHSRSLMLYGVGLSHCSDGRAT